VPHYVCLLFMLAMLPPKWLNSFIYTVTFFFFSNYFYACMLPYFKCHDFSFSARNFRVVFLTDFI